MGVLAKIFNFSRLFSQKMETLNRVTISKQSILHNYDLIAKLNSGKYVFPVLKSNAYGHGIQEIASILRERNPEYLVVDSYYEALKIWEVNPSKILLIGPILPENISKMNFKKIDLVVSDIALLEALGASWKKINIHIKIDTGMNRQWIYPHELKDFLKSLKKYKNLHLLWICSHLADADNKNNSYSELQMHRFEHALDLLKSQRIFPKYVHISNSAGALKDFLSGEVNSVRLWISLYGVHPLLESDTAFQKWNSLKLALDFETTLIQKKLLKAWEKVGYNGSFEAKQDMYIGIVPVGYFEGISRNLGNKFSFFAKNKPLPIIGKVCMNLCMVDLSQIPTLKVWEKVSVISSSKVAKNSVYEMAKLSGTIPYETLVKINESVRREVI